MQLARMLLLLTVTCAGLVGGSTLEFTRLSLSPDIASLSAISMRTSNGQFVVTGLSPSGSCVVALLNERLSTLALRHFPGQAVGEFCPYRTSFDSAGDIVIVGSSNAPDFPSTSILYPRDGWPNFLMKLDRSSLEVKYSTRFGLGTVLTMAIAPDDSVWLGGFAIDGLPTTPDAVQRQYPGPSNISPRDRAAFVVRFRSDGHQILYATYLAGVRDAVGTISIDHKGNVYAAGSQVWKFSPAGRLLWSTWLPPSSAFSSAIGANGDFYIVGSTGQLLPLYTTPGAIQPTAFDNQSYPQAGASIAYPAASIDGFVARFSPDGEVIYSTLMGGVRSDFLSDVVVNRDGSALVYGYSSGNLFPTRGALAILPAGPVLAKVSPDGTALAFSTYTAPSLSKPVVLGDESFLALSFDFSGEIAQTSIVRVTEVPDSLPRVDAVVDSIQPRNNLISGRKARISGEGMLAVLGVSVGGVPARVSYQSDSCIELEIPLDLPGLSPQSPFAGDIQLMGDALVLRSVRVLVFLAAP